MFVKLTLCADLTSSTVSVSADVWSGGQFTAPQLTTGQVIDLLICLDELGFIDSNTETDPSIN